MAYIETIDPEAATGEVGEMYARQQAHFGYVPSYARVFSHRPEVLRRWAALLAGIRRPMERRRFELATFAAARALGNVPCSLAHGQALLEHLSADDVRAVAQSREPESLSAAERAIVEFAAKVARDATAVTAADVASLRSAGLGDEEIFDVAAAAAGRAFFTKVLDALGVEPDDVYLEAHPELRALLASGRSQADMSAPPGPTEPTAAAVR